MAKDKEINVILVASYDRFIRTGPEGIMTKAYLKAKVFMLFQQRKQLTQIVQLAHSWKT